MVLMTIEQHYIQNQAILTSMYKDQGSGAAGVKPQVKGTNAEVPQSVMARACQATEQQLEHRAAAWRAVARSTAVYHRGWSSCPAAGSSSLDNGSTDG